MTFTPAAVPAQALSPVPRAGAAGRVAAGLAGAALLLLSCVVSVGFALAAPVGMLVARQVARSRRRPLTRFAGWGAAVAATSLAFAAAGATMAAKAPPGTFSHMERAMDSARVAGADEPLPGWVEKIAPGTAAAQRRSAATSLAQSRAFVYWGVAMGVAFTCALFGGFAGSLGWGATALLAYAARGRWPGSGAPATTTPLVDPALP